MPGMFDFLLNGWSRKGAIRPPSSDPEQVSVYKLTLRRQWVHSALIVLGMLSAGLGLKGFLLPSGFIDGGVTGISLLLSEISGLPVSVLLVVINLPFIYLGYNNIQRGFALKTLLAISGLALCLLFIPYPILTTDKLLVAVFGGFFLGAGVGLTMRGGGVIDGTEILAVTISRKGGLTVGDVILIINILIFSLAAFFLSVERAMYSILAYLAASRTIDFLISGLEEYTGVNIISSKSEEIRVMIINKLGRGVTIYNGKRGFVQHGERLHDTDIVFTVITRLEISNLKAEIEKIDPQAFVIMHSIKDTKGGMIKKRPLH